MNDEQHRLAKISAQPEGPGLFFGLTVLAPTAVAQLQHVSTALLDKKIDPAALGF